MDLLGRLIEWLFPWEYFNWSTDPSYGLCGSYYRQFRRNKHTGEWQGDWFSGGIPSFWPLWVHIHNPVLLEQLEHTYRGN